MRLALYSLLFIGTVLLVLDLMKEVKTIETPEKLEPTQRVDSPPPNSKKKPNDAAHNHPVEGHPNVEQTLELYSKAIKETPDKANPYVGRANAYIANNQLSEALNDFNKALEIEPANTDFLLQRGTLFLRLEKSDLAIVDFNTALKADPNFTKALIYRGISNFQSEKFQPALDDFLLLLKKDPKFTDLHLSISQCYFALDQKDKAQQHLKLYRTTTTDPTGKQKADALEKEWAKQQ